MVNFVLPGLADHSQIVSDPSALAMTIASLKIPEERLLTLLARRPLEVQVMVRQIQAGMWVRNGD